MGQFSDVIYTVRVFGFDTFAGFPERRSSLDCFADPHCEFADYEAVRSYCSPHNIELVAGDISETHLRLQGNSLILTLFDTDNYSPTRRALELCYELTVDGGILAFDHFYSPAWTTTLGERVAAKQVFAGKNLLNLHGTGIFIKLHGQPQNLDHMATSVFLGAS